jgi:hypothetical protein
MVKQDLEGMVLTPQNFKIAFIADTGLRFNARRVLELVARNNPDLLAIVGDTGYEFHPREYRELRRSILGDIPTLEVAGDDAFPSKKIPENRWHDYQKLLLEDIGKVPGIEIDGDYGIMSTVKYKGTTFVLSAAGIAGDFHEHAAYAETAFANSSSLWNFLLVHKPNVMMQIAKKIKETSVWEWDMYKVAVAHGAIMANGHEHIGLRTETLTDFQTREPDPEAPNPYHLIVREGATFAVCVGLGGRRLRPRVRYDVKGYPFMYTKDAGAKNGAMFIVINVGGNPRMANGYFKNIYDSVPDAFSIESRVRKTNGIR